MLPQEPKDAVFNHVTARNMTATLRNTIPNIHKTLFMGYFDVTH